MHEPRHPTPHRNGVNAVGGEEVSGLLRSVVDDFALRQRLLQFSNLCLGEVGVVSEIHISR